MFKSRLFGGWQTSISSYEFFLSCWRYTTQDLAFLGNFSCIDGKAFSIIIFRIFSLLVTSITFVDGVPLYIFSVSDWSDSNFSIKILFFGRISLWSRYRCQKRDFGNESFTFTFLRGFGSPKETLHRIKKPEI